MTKLSICVLILIASASCWWDGGHMMTAEIAKQEIMARNATLFAQIEKYVTIISPLCDERSQDFVQAASWADDIKDDAMSFWFNWHFYGKPINEQGLYLILSQDSSINNSVQAVQRAIFELKQQYELKIQNPQGISVQQAIMMRLLIHIVGDMHQPLHNVNMYNYTYPNSDLGGNKENLMLLNNTLMILHSYFDSGALRLDSFNRPLNLENYTRLQEMAKGYREEFPRSYFGKRVNISSPDDWAQESFDIAHNFIYPYIQETNVVTPEFDVLAYTMIKEQLALGGYRLANTLLSIFDPTFNSTTTFTQVQDEVNPSEPDATESQEQPSQFGLNSIFLNTY